MRLKIKLEAFVLYMFIVLRSVLQFLGYRCLISIIVSFDFIIFPRRQAAYSRESLILRDTSAARLFFFSSPLYDISVVSRHKA